MRTKSDVLIQEITLCDFARPCTTTGLELDADKFFASRSGDPLPPELSALSDVSIKRQLGMEIKTREWVQMSTKLREGPLSIGDSNGIFAARIPMRN
jgi:hypothetical protein